MVKKSNKSRKSNNKSNKNYRKPKKEPVCTEGRESLHYRLRLINRCEIDSIQELIDSGYDTNNSFRECKCCANDLISSYDADNIDVFELFLNHTNNVNINSVVRLIVFEDNFRMNGYLDLVLKKNGSLEKNVLRCGFNWGVIKEPYDPESRSVFTGFSLWQEDYLRYLSKNGAELAFLIPLSSDPVYMRFLIDMGADMNTKVYDHPLHYSSEWSDDQVCMSLRELMNHDNYEERWLSGLTGMDLSDYKNVLDHAHNVKTRRSCTKIQSFVRMCFAKITVHMMRFEPDALFDKEFGSMRRGMMEVQEKNWY